MNIFLLAIDPIVQEHKARTRSSLAAIGIADSLQLDMARISLLKADAERNLGDAGCSAQALNERHTDHSSVAVCGGVATTDITLELANVVEQSPIVQTAVTHIVLREVELRAVVAVIRIIVGCHGLGACNVAILDANGCLGTRSRLGREIGRVATAAKTLLAGYDIATPRAVVEVLGIEQVLVGFVVERSEVENVARLDGCAAVVYLLDLLAVAIAKAHLESVVVCTCGNDNVENGAAACECYAFAILAGAVERHPLGRNILDVIGRNGSKLALELILAGDVATCKVLDVEACDVTLSLNFQTEDSAHCSHIESLATLARAIHRQRIRAESILGVELRERQCECLVALIVEQRGIERLVGVILRLLDVNHGLAVVDLDVVGLAVDDKCIVRLPLDLSAAELCSRLLGETLSSELERNLSLGGAISAVAATIVAIVGRVVLAADAKHH